MEYVEVRTEWLQNLLERSQKLDQEVNKLVADGNLQPDTLLASELFFLLGYIGSAKAMLAEASHSLDPTTETQLEDIPF